MTRDIADLLVELTRRVQAAIDDADEAKAAEHSLREQREILLQQLHESEKRGKELKRRLYDLVDSHRALRARLAEFEKVAA